MQGGGGYRCSVRVKGGIWEVKRRMQSGGKKEEVYGE